MRPPNPLRVVLAVRRRKEEAEERVLASLGQQMQQVLAEAERLHAELASLAASRGNEVNCLLDGMHHLQTEARYRQLRQRYSETLSQIEKLAERRANQMVAYLAARCGREVISELEKRGVAAYRADLSMREQKRNEDIFLARRGWNRYTP